ncbi:MAG: peptide-methionine (S)-S-oxide reductase [Candidatus Brocadia sp.]|nr:Peptide methionine sulfoxide reductase MsrA [Anaerolineales bacterium]MCC6326413.1 peptide-methionine (S)-S-oxide reductase MsrA [Candidatus Brocadia sp.]MCE7913001.1 peptide-methionine (S)-S-oxide reductase [Candidatus Brocadia sp. AMX3]RIJ89448.1 MAG: peptide-methionine (S)-S-oxide reductase [Candidatus Brocadia sp.]
MFIHALLKSLLLGSLTLSGVFMVTDEKNQPATPPQSKEIVTLGGGCFWCIEAFFDELEGVECVESGYSGGRVDNPTYQQVCTGTTGYAEVVQITFDPTIVSFREILEVFFTMHDPTTLNRQGADVGTQYRSVIFYRNQEQKSVAEQVVREVQTAHLWDAPVVTEIAPFKAFYKGEDYHQDYYKLNPSQGYCRVVITPKIKKFREHFRKKLKKRNLEIPNPNGSEMTQSETRDG